MAKRKLDLVELGPALVGQLRVGLHTAPDALRGEGVAGEPVALVDAARNKKLRRVRLK